MVIARTAERASTGLLQDKPLKHSAGRVPRTRTRLLRAVLWLPALAKQATVAMPAQGIAQRAQQASTKLKRAMVIARTAERASTGLLLDKTLKPRARPAERASTGLLPDNPLKHRARPV